MRSKKIPAQNLAQETISGKELHGISKQAKKKRRIFNKRAK